MRGARFANRDVAREAVVLADFCASSGHPLGELAVLPNPNAPRVPGKEVHRDKDEPGTPGVDRVFQGSEGRRRRLTAVAADGEAAYLRDQLPRALTRIAQAFEAAPIERTGRGWFALRAKVKSRFVQERWRGRPKGLRRARTPRLIAGSRAASALGPATCPGAQW